MVLLGSCRKTLKKIIELLVGFVFLSCFPHKPRHTWSCAADSRWEVSAADIRADTVPRHTKDKDYASHSWMCAWTHTCLGSCSFLPKGTKSLRFMIWFLTRTFRAHIQIRIWLEVGSGPWLVWGDRELKKSVFPTASGGPLRNHSPSAVAPKNPSYSFKHRNKLAFVLSISASPPV